MEKMKDKFIGCLLGVAIGDKLGMRVEGTTHEQISQEFGFIKDYLAPSETTDDTELALILARSLVDSGGFNIDDFADKLRQSRNQYFGWSTSSALYLLRHGVSHQETGQDSHGDGAAMRSAPVGLFYYDNWLELKKVAIESARITHNNPQAIAGAVAIAFSVAHVLLHDDLDSFLADVGDFVEDIDTELSQAIKHADKIHDYNSLRKKGIVIEAVPAALYCFIKNPDDFESTVLTAINGGGDTDTIAAMAGAISGAYNGVDKIPVRFIDGLEQKREIIDLVKKMKR